MKVNIVPMAGEGKRFSEAGYFLPKPLIPVSGQPMILKAIEMLPQADRWIFLVRQEHIDNFRIDNLLKKEIPQAIIIPVEKTTEGQASTCMLAFPYIKDENEILIAACDNSFLYDEKKFAQLKADPTIDAIVWTFTQDELLTENPRAWGWLKLEADKLTIQAVSIKTPVSANPYDGHAVVATFYFKRAKDFKAAYGLMVKENYRINNEFYVDAIPIFLKQLGKRSVIFDVDLYVGWGKPTDLYKYQEAEYQYYFGSETDSKTIRYAAYFKKFDQPRQAG